MAFTKLQFKSGINKEITPYSEENGWVDCDKVRFRFGYPEKLNGWEKNSTNSFLGDCRGLHDWRALSGESFLGVGTQLKYYIQKGVGYNDVTPIRETTAAGDVTFSATNGSSTITVTDVNHGCVENDFVTFSGAASLGGNITANILNQEYQIVSVTDSNTYTIQARTVSTISSITEDGVLNPTLVNANSSDTGNGGASVVGAYQIGTGLNSSVAGTGWGAGLWGGTNNGALQTTLNEGGTLSDSDTTITVTSATGIAATDVVLIGGTELVLVGGVSSNDLTGCTRGYNGTTASSHADGSVVRLTDGNASGADDFNGWGEGISTGVETATTGLRIWSHDNFGEDLILNERNGQVFYWDKTNGVETRAVELSTLSGSPTSVPQRCAQILLSDRDRHVIAFGADGLGATSSEAKGDTVQDPMLIRFSSQENPIDWYPTDTNTAGDLRIDTGSRIVQAVETRQQIAVLTDSALYAMQFIGPPFTFGINLVSSNITIASPRAAVAVNDIVYWMGNAEFYNYAGAVQRIPCTVRDYVFNDFNVSQMEKVIAGSNVSYGEVWWFYPSANSEENDRYVVFNYQENIWYIGTLTRTAWLDRGVNRLPIATADGYLYNHEIGAKADGQAMTSYIESGDMDISDGNQFSFISRVIPDLNFRETSVNNTTVNFILNAKNAPGQTSQTTDTDTITKTSSTPVDQYTNQYQTRVRGRSFTFKVESTDADVLWRLGIPRVDIRQDGRR